MARTGNREMYWREQVQRQPASGMGVRQFCKSVGLSEPSFYAWRQKLKQREYASEQPAFLPITVVPATPSETAHAGREIILELRGGRRLRWPEALPLTTLVEFVSALEANEVTR